MTAVGDGIRRLEKETVGERRKRETIEAKGQGRRETEAAAAGSCRDVRFNVGLGAWCMGRVDNIDGAFFSVN